MVYGLGLSVWIWGVSLGFGIVIFVVPVERAHQHSRTLERLPTPRLPLGTTWCRPADMPRYDNSVVVAAEAAAAAAEAAAAV